jgi:hypothetical protein
MRTVVFVAALAALWAAAAAAENVYVWRPPAGQYGSQVLSQSAFLSHEEGGGMGYDFVSREFGSLSRYYPISTRSVRVGEVLTFTVPKSLKVSCHLIADMGGTLPTRWLEFAQKENQVTVKGLATGRLAAEVRCAETVPVDGQSYLQIEYLDMSIT